MKRKQKWNLNVNFVFESMYCSFFTTFIDLRSSRALKRVWYFITHRFQLLLFWYRDRRNATFSKHSFSESVLLCKYKYIWRIYAFVIQMFWVIIYLVITCKLNSFFFLFFLFNLRINKRPYVFGAQTWFSCWYELSLQISIWNMFAFIGECNFRLNA